VFCIFLFDGAKAFVTIRQTKILEEPPDNTSLAPGAVASKIQPGAGQQRI
jgi:hypothetical protein